MSSITNFAVSIYIARSVGAADYGAFALAYVTYAFVLSASRGLATDPLLVRYSGANLANWRPAVARCTGTAAMVGVVSGVLVLLAAALLDHTARVAFLALGLTLPALLLQDSWRFCFFALGKGSQAFLNDTAWAVALVPALIAIRATGHASVFWFVLAWGATSAAGALIGPIQARVLPRITGVRGWLVEHRDLGLRYLAEGGFNSSQAQLRTYSVGLVLGLAALGYVQAAGTLMGPFMVVFFGMGLVTLPEAVRILRRAPHHMPVFCILVSSGLALAGLLWGTFLLVALPHGLGRLALGNLWLPTYPLILPLTISVVGGCLAAGAGTGLHALGAAKQSLRAMIISSVSYVAFGFVGAVLDGPAGVMWGAAAATWLGAAVFWWELRVALREYGDIPVFAGVWSLLRSRARPPARLASSE
jgi:O-antigen/teichoic acid export membrane protein